MIKRLKTMITGLVLMVGGLAPAALAPVAVYAQDPTIQQGLCAGAELDAATGDCTAVQDSQVESSITNIATLLINLFSIVVGIVAVVMIILGGFKYITSGGDSNNVSSAKNTILFAIVGLVIVALAQFIVRFVLNRTLDAV